MIEGMNAALDELRAIVMRAGDKWTDTGIPHVTMVKAEACASQVYQPMLHLVLQGSKTLSIGDQIAEYPAVSYFVVPIDVPATGDIHASGPEQPYLAVSLALEPDAISAVLTQGGEALGWTPGAGFSALAAPAEMIDAWLRMMRLIDHPDEAAVMAPLIEREIIFRALQGPLGSVLRDIACPGGHISQIRRVIHWIREHFAEPLRIEPLAAMANMSVAAFYRHFKTATSMTPIQYQKRLRLLRARWLLLFEPRDASSIAFTVGYESASQFSREYARFFGMPPTKDIARFKSSDAPQTMLASLH